ncbi:HvfC/BufC N-terminal domain-containing protein [Acidicapsa acidisoli]|uniref:HvfC/BufC N-terminal domain-containing protein n=1 Tax=Acidicapsa acidisoli TaxID=1615681 RepID=UPI0021E02C63|nr:DNA-binding domain-containing protein [Acidicapsa acidisoli]
MSQIMNVPMKLEDLQRTMCAAVMQPLTADEEMQSHDVTGRWNGRAMAEVAEQFIAPNNRLTAFERLEIYNRQYWFRLQSAFTEDFPALRSVVGAERFDALMNAYLAAHPSRSFTLRNLGSKLYAWLSQNSEYAGRRLALALDVVSVEWACIEAFDNAELAPLSPAEVAAVHAESRFALQPYVQLLALQYPADDIVLDMHRRQKRESSEAGARPEAQEEEHYAPLRLRKRATWLAVHRADFSLYYKRLTHAEYRTLTALREGRTLSEALEAGFAGSHMAIGTQINQVRAWFAQWAELGWICKPADTPANL